MSETQNTKTITGTVERVVRTGRTYYGNPIMRIAIDGEIYRISDNAALVYEIENPEFKATPHTFRLTKAGRIASRVH